MTKYRGGMGFYDDGTETQQAANDQACYEARKSAGMPHPEDVEHKLTGGDCESDCPIFRTTCPFRRH